MLAHSSQERSGLCEEASETKQIEKKFLQTVSFEPIFWARCAAAWKNPADSRVFMFGRIQRNLDPPFGSAVMNRPQ
jgi:hypothetical protein